MYVVPDLAPFALGPVVLAGDRAFVAIVLLAVLVAVEIRSRRRGADAEVGWTSVWIGLLVARVAWIATHPSSYLANPLEALFVWQGGFVAWAGLAAGIAWASWRTYAQGRPAADLATPLAAGAAVALVAMTLLPVAPDRPALGSLDLSVRDLAGSEATVASWTGRPTVVNLWATWCGPCRRELPMLIEELGGREDLRLALVSQREASATVRAYLDAQGLPPDDVWLDGAGALGRAVALAGLPTTLFVDAGGEVREVVFGEISRSRLLEAASRIGVPDGASSAGASRRAGVRAVPPADRSARHATPFGGG